MFDMNTVNKIPPALLQIITLPLSYFSKSSFQGAQTSLYLAASSKVDLRDSGMYYDKSAPAATGSKANNPELEKWLWEESEKLTRVKYL